MINKLLKVGILNTIFISILFFLYRNGILNEVWKNDILYIIPTIVFIFILGNIFLIFNSIKKSEWCAETIVVLGFLGTCLGIWQAFSGIDSSHVGDIKQIGVILSTLLVGLGAALWTTMTGVFFNIWLTATMEIVEENKDE